MLTKILVATFPPIVTLVISKKSSPTIVISVPPSSGPFDGAILIIYGGGKY